MESKKRERKKVEECGGPGEETDRLSHSDNDTERSIQWTS